MIRGNLSLLCAISQKVVGMRLAAVRLVAVYLPAMMRYTNYYLSLLRNWIATRYSRSAGVLVSSVKFFSVPEIATYKSHTIIVISSQLRSEETE